MSFIDRIYVYLLINSRSLNITSDSQELKSGSPILLAICLLADIVLMAIERHLRLSVDLNDIALRDEDLLARLSLFDA